MDQPPQVTQHSMSLIASAWKAIAMWSMGLLLASFGWLGRHQLKRIDDLEDNVADMSANNASKDDVNKVHRRLDDIYKLLLKNKKENEHHA